MINHYKDPYELISIMECHKGFKRFSDDMFFGHFCMFSNEIWHGKYMPAYCILIHLDLFFLRKIKTLLKKGGCLLFGISPTLHGPWFCTTLDGILKGAGGRECQVAKGVMFLVVVSNTFLKTNIDTQNDGLESGKGI